MAMKIGIEMEVAVINRSQQREEERRIDEDENMIMHSYKSIASLHMHIVNSSEIRIAVVKENMGEKNK